jgi:methylamine--corrinoid protein Co-methyltransferase
VIKVTEEEIQNALRNAPSKLNLGQGNDKVVMKHRQMEDEYPPLCVAPLGIVFSEDIWVPVMQGIVENREIDIFQGGSLATIFSHRVYGGTPTETLLGRYQAQLTREALRRAGRPGMHTQAVISSTTEYGQLGGFGTVGGFDPTNSTALVLLTGELQAAYESWHKVASAINCGAIYRVQVPSIIGGYAGPAEGAILTQIAVMLLILTIFKAQYIGSSVYDIRHGGTCGREGQWATSVIHQSTSRNTHILRTSTGAQLAGPCTKMLLYESAIFMMNFAVSGAEGAHVCRSAGGKYTDYLTPLECKFCGEVLKMSAGMTRKQVNDIAKVLIPKYEDALLDPPKGKSVRECYDLKTLKPTQEWLDIYLDVKKKLISLGVPLES